MIKKLALLIAVFFINVSVGYAQPPSGGGDGGNHKGTMTIDNSATLAWQHDAFNNQSTGMMLYLLQKTLTDNTAATETCKIMLKWETAVAAAGTVLNWCAKANAFTASNGTYSAGWVASDRETEGMNYILNNPDGNFVTVTDRGYHYIGDDSEDKDFGVGFWINVNDLTSAQHVFSFLDGAGDDEFDFYIDTDGSIVAKFYDGAGTLVFTSSAAQVTVGNWYHIHWFCDNADNAGGFLTTNECKLIINGSIHAPITGVNTSYTVMEGSTAADLLVMDSNFDGKLGVFYFVIGDGTNDVIPLQPEITAIYHYTRGVYCQ